MVLFVTISNESLGVSEFLHPDVSKFRFYSLKFDSVLIFTFQILKI